MGVATNARECELFLKKATDVSPQHPVVVSKFFEDSKEIEVDAVASCGQFLALASSNMWKTPGFIPGMRPWLFRLNAPSRR